MGALKPQRRTQPLVSRGPVGERPAQVVGVAARLLGSFDGPEPGGPELIRKCKRELERGRERERKKERKERKRFPCEPCPIPATPHQIAQLEKTLRTRMDCLC